MLSDPLLIDHVKEGHLIVYVAPKGFAVRTQRLLLVTPDVHEKLFQDPWERMPGELSREATERKRRKHALLGRYINGDIFVPNSHVKGLRPTAAEFQNLLEFRSGPPSPQSRVFALVFAPGVWIGLGFHLRCDLGDIGDPRWLDAAKDAQDAWRGLFPGRSPVAVPFPCDSKAKLKALLDA